MKPIHLLWPILLAGCGHAEPFVTETPGEGGPWDPGPPVRLTYNIGQDAWATWSADGATLYYSAQDTFTVDKDRCIVRLPGGGGTRSPLACPADPGGNDTTEILDQPAVRGGELVYASSTLGVDEHSPFRIALWRMRDTTFAPATRLFDFPYTAPSGRSHDAPLFLQWLRDGVLLYIGAENGCCRKDTMRFGEQVVLLDVSGPAPARTFVPGTTRASAVQASADGTTICYTIAGDSRVYRQLLATGQVDTLHDFGPGRVARDPQLRGTTLFAIVDGHDGFTDLPPFYAVQVDYGGKLVAVDLGTGTERRQGDTLHLYKRPRLAPGGGALAVEGYPMTINVLRDSTGTIILADTSVSRWADLWLLEE
ncbi:MAG: hypothetical protein U0104_13740 [Gemmatimonadales bacterium]